jgi:signal transduction protein with GAF and PtsI domain
MEEKIIVTDMEGMPTVISEEAYDWVITTNKKQEVVKENQANAAIEQARTDAKRRRNKVNDVARRQNRRDVIDVTHRWKKQFFTVEEKRIENPERFRLKKVTNGYEGNTTK